VRDAPAEYADCRAVADGRTPHELLWHMTGVLGYARSFFLGGVFRPDKLPFDQEVLRFHAMLQELDRLLAADTPLREITLEQLLQGPLADAMTHAGQLSMLRRFVGDPVPSENFVHADVRTGRVGADQPPPAAPDPEWTPDRPPHPPGRRRHA
jgi:hypothetical protein